MKRILYVEDDEIAAKVGQHLLELVEGVETTHSPTGYQALKLYEPDKFDLLIVDLGLPDISGVELVQLIKKRYGGCPPVVAITAHVNETDGPIKQISKVYAKPLTFQMANEIMGLY